MEKIDLSRLFENDSIVWLEEEKILSSAGPSTPKETSTEEVEGKKSPMNFEQHWIIFHEEEEDHFAFFNQILSAKPLQLSPNDWVLVHQNHLSYQEYIKESTDKGKRVLVMGVEKNLSNKITPGEKRILRNKTFFYSRFRIATLKNPNLSKQDKLEFWESLKLIQNESFT